MLSPEKPAAYNLGTVELSITTATSSLNDFLFLTKTSGGRWIRARLSVSVCKIRDPEHVMSSGSPELGDRQAPSPNVNAQRPRVRRRASSGVLACMIAPCRRGNPAVSKDYTGGCTKVADSFKVSML
jgi:hypothetical protein